MIKKLLQLVFKFFYWITRLKIFDMATGEQQNQGTPQSGTRTRQVVTGKPFWADRATDGNGHWQEKKANELEAEFASSKREDSPYFWVGYPNREFARPFSYGPMQRERYEKFCLGFLYFYDKYIYTGSVKGAEAHAIYFMWENGSETIDSNNKAKANKVSIFISPQPKKFSERELRYQPTAIESSD